MNEIELKLDKNGRGAFVIDDGGRRMAEMVIGISGSDLTVYHTEVSDELRGQGVAAKLLSKMVGYARERDMKVIPLCPYVNNQFKRHAGQYEDIWNKNWHA